MIVAFVPRKDGIRHRSFGSMRTPSDRSRNNEQQAGAMRGTSEMVQQRYLRRRLVVAICFLGYNRRRFRPRLLRPVAGEHGAGCWRQPLHCDIGRGLHESGHWRLRSCSTQRRAENPGKLCDGGRGAFKRGRLSGTCGAKLLSAVPADRRGYRAERAHRPSHGHKPLVRRSQGSGALDRQPSHCDRSKSPLSWAKPCRTSGARRSWRHRRSSLSRYSLFLLLRDPASAQFGATGEGTAKGSSVVSSEARIASPLKNRQILSMRSFRVFSLAMGIMSGTGSVFYAHMVPFGTSQGMSLTAAAGLLSANAAWESRTCVSLSAPWHKRGSTGALRRVGSWRGS